MGRNVGGMGEDLLGVWSHQIGIIANRSLNKDAAGWDYILEWPVENSGSPHEVKIPLDNSPCPLKCVLQVKSIDSMRRGIPVKLSNWFHLVRNPLPAFFLILDFARQQTCQKGYLVHIGRENIARVQERLRELHLKEPNCNLSKKTMQLNWEDKDLLLSLDGEGLQAAIMAYVVPDMDRYVQMKQELCRTVGYEEGGWEMQVTGKLPFNVDPEEHLIDFDLGIVSQLELTSGILYDDRFGMRIQRSRLEAGSILEIDSREPIGAGEIEITDEQLGKSVKIDCQVYVPSDFGHLLPKEKIRARFLHCYMDFSVPLAGAQRKFSFTVRFPKPEESVSIRELHDVAKLVLLLHEAVESSHQLRLTARFEDFQSGGEISTSKSFSPLVVDWAQLVLSAWIVARHFELDESLKLSTQDISRHKGPLRALAGFLDPQLVNFKVTFWLSEPASMHGKECCIPMVTMASLGRHIVGVGTGAIGTMQLTGERKDSDVQYEVVTHDIRVVCQHAGCDSASSLSKVEEMKERVVKKYEYMQIVHVDV